MKEKRKNNVVQANIKKDVSKTSFKKKVKPKKNSSSTTSPLKTVTGVFDKIGAGIAVSLFGELPQPLTAQETLPYDVIYPDGISQLNKKDGKYFTKTIYFSDLNYISSLPESQSKTFQAYGEFLNSFPIDAHLQISIQNEKISMRSLQENIYFYHRKDGLNMYRDAYSKHLFELLKKGNNQLLKKRYITFGIYADSLSEAKKRLVQIESSAIVHLNRLGVKHRVLNGKERIELLHRLLRDKVSEKLEYSFEEQALAGLSSKDAIAPMLFDFRQKNYFRYGNHYGSSGIFKFNSTKLFEDVMSNFLAIDGTAILSIHIDIVDMEKALKQVKNSITVVDSMKVHHNKKAVSEGYDMDILPPDLKLYSESSVQILDGLQQNDEHYFEITFTITQFADTKDELDKLVTEAEGLCSSISCPLVRLETQQEDAFMSALPLGENTINIQRGVLSSVIAGLVPFTTRDLNMGKNAFHYGTNPLSQRLILADRKKVKNPNGLIFGIPGGGKSVSAKMEIIQAVLKTTDDVIVCDPENEYRPLVEALNGEIVEISPSSNSFLNPLDINIDYADKTNPLHLKYSFIQSLFEIMTKKELTGKENSLIDKAMVAVYEPYRLNPQPANMPILGDMYEFLINMDDEVAKHLAESIEIYVKGSSNVFNNRTNINTDNRLICFEIKDLTDHLKEMGMIILQDQVWNRVTANRKGKKATWYFVDEFHLLLARPQTAQYMLEIWKRFRKYGGIPTGITQNVGDVLKSLIAEDILNITPFIRMLQLYTHEAEILQEFLRLSDEQTDYIIRAGTGSGLLSFSQTVLPFDNRLPSDNIIYDLITTKPEESSI